VLEIVNEGDRVAQLILEKIETPEVVEVDVRSSGIIRVQTFLVLILHRSSFRNLMPLLEEQEDSVRPAGLEKPLSRPSRLLPVS
jgi:hypothetical protein